MYYFNEIKDIDGTVYSCDSIRLEFQLKAISDLLVKVSQFCISCCDNYYTSFKTWSYKYCFNFNLALDVSFTVLVGLNTYGKVKSVVVVDFNPNKCMHFDRFKKIISYLYRLCYFFGLNGGINDVVIKRYDVAIDIPCDRKYLSVVWKGKGAKLHELIQTTIDDTTEYFGERNSIGRLKIYNKSLEDIRKQSSELKEQYKKGLLPRISRIEITHNTFDSIILYSSLPSSFTKYDLNFLPDSFNTTDYILVNACRDNSKYIPYLKQSRVKWEKLRKYIINTPYFYNIDILSDIIFQITCYTDMATYDCSNTADLEDYISSICSTAYDFSIIEFESDKILDSITLDTTLEVGNLEDYEEIGEC